MERGRNSRAAGIFLLAWISIILIASWPGARRFVIAERERRGRGPRALAYDAKNDRLLVANWSSDTVLILDRTSLEILAEVQVVSRPYRIVIDPVIDSAYVLGYGSTKLSQIRPAGGGFDVLTFGDDDSYPFGIATIGSSRSTVIMFRAKRPIEGGEGRSFPYLYAPVQRLYSWSIRLYNSRFLRHKLLHQGREITMTDLMQEETLSLSVLERSADESRLYLVNGMTEELIGVELDPMRIAYRRALGRKPAALCEDPNKGRLFVAQMLEPRVEVFEAQTGRPLEPVQAPVGVVDMEIHPARGTLYLLDRYEEEVLEIDAETSVPLRRLPIGPAPTDLLILPEMEILYATIGGSDRMVEIALEDFSVTREIDFMERSM